MKLQNVKKYKFREWMFSLLTAVIMYLYGILAAITTGVFKVENGIILYVVEFYNSHPIIYGIAITVLSLVVIWIMQINPILEERMKSKIDKDGITKKYEEFISDAKSLKIFGGDLSYLLESNVQLAKMIKLGNKCEVLCYPPSNNELYNRMKPIYKELLDNNVDIRMYNKSNISEIMNFRGQNKENESGHVESFYVKIINDFDGIKLYEPINLDNLMISKLIHQKFESIHKNSLNPIIRHVLMDLGGVYFDGDYYEDFLNPVNDILGSSIKPKLDQKVLLDSKLNLGEIDIIQYLESEIKRQISESDRVKIKSKWKNVWKPNSEMIDIVREIKNNGFEVYPFSNLDEENGIEYIKRGDFENFSEKTFLSFERKLTKPDDAFFNLIKEELNAETYEILLIDDQEKNLLAAKKLGLDTIKFSSAAKLRTKLQSKRILPYCES